jgi:hypothetical protein
LPRTSNVNTENDVSQIKFANKNIVMLPFARLRKQRTNGPKVHYKAVAKLRQEENRIIRLLQHKKATFASYINEIARIKPNQLNFEPAVYGVSNRHAIVPDDQRIDNTRGQTITKITVSDKGKLAEILNRRTLGSPTDPTDLYDSEGKLIARHLPNAIPEKLARAWPIVKQLHELTSTGWAKGCEADTLPNPDQMMNLIKDPVSMQGFGLSDKTEILSIEFKTTTTTSLQVVYRNRKGQSKRFQIAMKIDRHTTTRDKLTKIITAITESCDDPDLQLELENATDLLLHLESVYRKHAHDFYADRMWSKQDAEAHLNGDTLKLHLSSNLSSQGSPFNIGIHKDPPSPSPALIAGSTTYSLRNGTWSKNCKGGRLFYADGLVDLSYGPRDIILMDGNIPHGVTNMRDPVPEMAGLQLQRFSLVLFDKFGRERMKKHGNYKGNWKDQYGTLINN